MKKYSEFLRRFILCGLLLCAAVVSVAAAEGVPPHLHKPGEEHLTRLRSLAGVQQVILMPSGEFAGKYEVMISQCVDWQNPEAGTFDQRVVVMHVGWDRPTIFITQGYSADFCMKPDYRDELSKLFDANIVLVEHRYFGRSVPKPFDWKYLTAENSACDLHRIRALFGQVYPGKWVASGISKGGTTTMLYAAYFPDDVDAYVPYVGPLCKSVEDNRFWPYIHWTANPDARAAVEKFQIELFERRDALLPLFREHCREKRYRFRIPVDEIYDYCVLEYGFAFWQWGSSAEDVPDATAPDDVVFDNLLRISGPEYFDADSFIAPFFVQAARELGYYPYDLKPFRKYTSIRSTHDYLRRIFLPEELRSEPFSKELYRKIRNYLKKNDPRMVMIYGGGDPWTAPGAGWCVSPRKRNMKVYTAPGGSHRTRIATLSEQERAEAIATLRGWLED